MSHRSRRPMTRSTRPAFSLIELLVVVSLIILLIALLLPGLGKAREFSRDLVCRSQMRQVGFGFFTFSNDHQGRLPGCYASLWVGPEEWQGPWMGSEAWPWGTSRRGTLLNYMGGEESALAVYRCPSLPKGVFASGVGSNGNFDYGSYLSWVGARKYSIPLEAYWVDPADDSEHPAPTPLLTEEDPRRHMNYCCIEPGHSNIDAMGTWHDGAANYFAFDGTVQRCKPSTELGPSTWDWFAETPKGDVVPLTSHGTGFGGWQKR